MIVLIIYFIINFYNKKSNITYINIYKYIYLYIKILNIFQSKFFHNQSIKNDEFDRNQYIFCN